MIDALRASLPNKVIPDRFLGTYLLASPFKGRCVARRIWPLLDYLLFVLASILELCICSEIMLLGRFRVFCCKLIESSKGRVHRTMSSGCGFDRISLQEAFCFFFMLLYPKFVISFVQSVLRGRLVRAVISWTWIIARQSLGILVKVDLLSYTDFTLLQLFFFLIFFLDGLFETVCTYSWRFPILLLHFNPFKVSVFDQFWIDLDLGTHLFEFFEIPLLLLSMCKSRWNSLCYFELIVHIKPSFGDILGVLLSLLL